MFFTKPLLLLSIALSVSVGINLLLLSDRYKDQIVISVPDGDSLQLQDGRRIRSLESMPRRKTDVLQKNHGKNSKH